MSLRFLEEKFIASETKEELLLIQGTFSNQETPINMTRENLEVNLW